MDVFAFRNPTAPTKMEQGEIINNLKSKLWIERYRDAGEFTFVASASSGMRALLPIGSFVSHVDTTEIMIVENHEIADDKEKDSDIVITGRGLESYLEQRVVGSNKSYAAGSAAPSDYILPADYTWNQAVKLISDHVLVANLVDPNNAFPWLSVLSSVPGAGVNLQRVVKMGDVYKKVLEILDVDDLGQKIIRPGPWSPLGAASPNVAHVIHKGVDRRGQIIFSSDTGEIESADYLWSNKKTKNAAVVSGRWVEVFVAGASTSYARRTMFVDANDIDNSFAAAPVGAELATVVSQMQQRGAEALAAQKDIALTKAEISRTAVNAKYRTDFDVGDLITVDGDFNETSSMRVTEYVEIEDEKGRSGYPTLTMA